MCLLSAAIPLHTKLAAVAHPAEGQFLHVAENMVKFVTLQDGIVGLILSIKEGQNVYLIKIRLNEEHHFDAFYLVK
jgi:hypothetical protein